jgi:hypothetical protein
MQDLLFLGHTGENTASPAGFNKLSIRRIKLEVAYGFFDIKPFAVVDKCGFRAIVSIEVL